LMAGSAPSFSQAGTGRTLPEPTEPQIPPSRALISGVPYISFREAERQDYPDKNILNPSFTASLEMVLKYWGLDSWADLKKKQAEGPQDWVGGLRQAASLIEVKRFIARGIPVMVSPAMTPFAHPPSPVMASQAVALGGVKLKERGPYSGVLGRMVSLDSFRQIQEFLLKKYKNPDLIWESLLLSNRVIIGYNDERNVITLHDPSFGPAWELSYDDF
ncbi:MAG: hypothetical protein ACREIQ_11870, partial [Nitrospiria bacterium]